MQTKAEKELLSVVFIEIETVPIVPTVDQLPETLRNLWFRKAKILKDADTKPPEQLFIEKGKLFAEYAKVASLALAYCFQSREGDLQLRSKAFAGAEEAPLLLGLKETLSASHFAKDRGLNLCAHNGKSFHFPFLARRYVLNKIIPPQVLDLLFLKPWEMHLHDTLEMWRFGDRRTFVSLRSLAIAMGFPQAEKLAVEALPTYNLYYQQQDYKALEERSRMQVEATAQIYRQMRGLEPIDENNIVRK